MTLCLNCALKALPCPLASTLNACWFMSACLRRLAGWGRVEWTRDTEYWERMVDDYQTQHGEGSKTESPSNPSLCHRVSMIQMSLCDGKYRLFWVYFQNTLVSKKFISECLGDLRNDGHSWPSFVKLKHHDWQIVQISFLWMCTELFRYTFKV